jgi:ankyrin repeat protein
MHGAVQNGDVEAVELLLQHGADPKMRGEYGMTALLVATGNGRVPVVKPLHERGLSLHDSDFDRTLLLSAAHWGYVSIVSDNA